MNSPSSYLSISEAAERMHVLPQTVEHWIGTGVLLAQEKPNAKAQVLGESVTQWLSEKNHLPIIRPVSPDVLKVAVVEDDPDIVKLLEMSIEGFGNNMPINIPLPIIQIKMSHLSVGMYTSISSTL